MRPLAGCKGSVLERLELAREAILPAHPPQHAGRRPGDQDVLL